MKTIIVVFFMLLFGSSVLFSVKYAMALQMSDFLPSFLVSKKNQENNQNIARDRKLNTNQDTSNINSIEVGKVNSEYCPNTQDTHVVSGASSKDNVSVDKIDLSNSLHVKSNNLDGVDHSNKVSTNQSSDQTTASSDASIKTDSNQLALQDQSTKNALDKYQGAFLLPIQPQKDVKMNINNKQIQVNIKY